MKTRPCVAWMKKNFTGNVKDCVVHAKLGNICQSICDWIINKSN